MAIKERILKEGVADGFRQVLAEEVGVVPEAVQAGVERAFFDWLEANREALLERIAAAVMGD